MTTYQIFATILAAFCLPYGIWMFRVMNASMKKGCQESKLPWSKRSLDYTLLPITASFGLGGSMVIILMGIVFVLLAIFGPPTFTP